MKKLLWFGMMILATVCIPACSSSNNDDPDGPDVPPDDPDKDAISTQFVNKTVNTPAANFPAVDVSAASFTLLKGKYQAKKNGTQFNGNDFADGVLLNEGDEITIEQGGEKLITFSPKTGGAGTRIKILGIGGTSGLTDAEGVGRGVYTWKVDESAADANGYLKGTKLYAGGNENNLVQSITLEGGVKYLLRRDYFGGDMARDVEGWIYFWADLGNGYAVSDPNWAISIYPEQARNLPIDQQVPIITSHSLPNAGYYNFIFSNLINPDPIGWAPGETGGDHVWMYAAGNGVMSAMFVMNNWSINAADYDFTGEGLDPEVGNPDIWARAFWARTEFKLYLTDNKENLTEATPEQYKAFVSDAGIDPGNKYLIVKTADPENMVNTTEDLAFVFKRRAAATDPTARIRMECVFYDEAKNTMPVVDGMNIRTVPAPAPEGE